MASIEESDTICCSAVCDSISCHGLGYAKVRFVRFFLMDIWERGGFLVLDGWNGLAIGEVLDYWLPEIFGAGVLCLFMTYWWFLGPCNDC